LCALRGGEVQFGDGAGQFAVGFFWPGGIQVAGAQAGFDVGDRDLLVVGGEGGGEGGGGVAVDQDDVGFAVGEDAFHALQDGGGDVGEVLAGLHDVEVVVGFEVEQCEYLVEHFAVLAGDADAGFELRVGGELQGQGGHFYGLGAGAEDGQGFELGHGVLWWFLVEDKVKVKMDCHGPLGLAMTRFGAVWWFVYSGTACRAPTLWLVCGVWVELELDLPSARHAVPLRFGWCVVCGVELELDLPRVRHAVPLRGGGAVVFWLKSKWIATSLCSSQ